MSDGWYTEGCEICTWGSAYTLAIFRRSAIMSPCASGDSQLSLYLRVCGIQILVKSSFHSLTRESSQRATYPE
jgi:hypothetical protein